MAHAQNLNGFKRFDPPNLDGPFEVLELLQPTTHAGRSTRNCLSSSDESTTTIRAHFKPSSLGRGHWGKHPRRPRIEFPPSTSSSPSSFPTPGPIVLVRRSALEITVLRQLEETCQHPLSDEAYDAQSDGGHSLGVDTRSSLPNTVLDLRILTPARLSLSRWFKSRAGTKICRRGREGQTGAVGRNARLREWVAL